MIEIDPEKAAADKLARAKHTIAVGRLRQQWARESYDPRAHLRGATAEGDRSVLAFMAHRERSNHDTTRNFAVWLAVHDIYDAMDARRTDSIPPAVMAEAVAIMERYAAAEDAELASEGIAA